MATSVEQAMLDTQKALVHATPIGTLPPGAVPTWSADNSVVTLDSSVDPSGLSVMVLGVHGSAGDAIVTVSYTNPDGSVATGSATFHMSLDPAESDVTGFDIVIDPPEHQ